MTPPKLTPKQEKFCLQYAQHGNGTQAAREAGYKGSDKTLAAVAIENLGKPRIQEFLRGITSEKQKKSIADATERQEFLTSVMRGQVRATFVTREGLMTGHPDFPARLKAAELLSKLQGDFRDPEGGSKAPSVVINMPSGPMTPEEMEEARRKHAGP